MPPVASAVAEVRRVLRDHCARMGCGRIVDTLALLASELVANAILHAVAPIRFTVRNDGQRVTVLIEDGTAVMPSLRTPGDGLEERGRGLLLVDALADDWGSERTDTGKTVWFSLPY